MLIYLHFSSTIIISIIQRLSLALDGKAAGCFSNSQSPQTEDVAEQRERITTATNISGAAEVENPADLLKVPTLNTDGLPLFSSSTAPVLLLPVKLFPSFVCVCARANVCALRIDIRILCGTHSL